MPQAANLVALTDNGVICIKTLERHNDPLELAEEGALELGELLIRLVKEMR